MARTQQQIFNDMVTYAQQQAANLGNADAVNMFNNTSKIAIWRFLFWCFSYAVWVFETIMDNWQTSINTTIANEFPHSLRWYRTKALAFMFGYNLITDTDQYDTTGLTADQISAAQVVQYAAINETEVDGKRVLLLKIAGVNGNDLAPISDVQLAAFTAYMQEVKDAGNKLIIYNRVADQLQCEVDFYYNPLLLDATGARLDGQGQTPVPDAAQNYLLNLPFNGEFSNAQFIDALQSAYGCADRNVFLKSISKQTGTGDWVAVNNTVIPDAGYIRFITNGLKINYIAHVQG